MAPQSHFFFLGREFMRRRILWTAVAVVPMLMAAAWASFGKPVDGSARNSTATAVKDCCPDDCCPADCCPECCLTTATATAGSAENEGCPGGCCLSATTAKVSANKDTCPP